MSRVSDSQLNLLFSPHSWRPFRVETLRDKKKNGVGSWRRVVCGMVHLLIAIDRLILLACQLSSPTRRAPALNSWDLTSLEIGTGGLCKENGRDEPNRKWCRHKPPYPCQPQSALAVRAPRKRAKTSFLAVPPLAAVFELPHGKSVQLVVEVQALKTRTCTLCEYWGTGPWGRSCLRLASREWS